MLVSFVHAEMNLLRVFRIKFEETLSIHSVFWEMFIGQEMD